MPSSPTFLTVLRVALSSCLIALLLVLPAYSQPVDQKLTNYDLPALSLTEALSQVTQLNGLQIVYPSSYTKDLSAPEIKGSYSLNQVLDLLLDASGLKAVFLDQKIITLQRVAQPRVKEIAVEKEQDEKRYEDSIHVENVTVTGSRIPRPEYEVLFPTRVIDQQIMFRANHTNIGDALEGQPILCPGLQSFTASGANRNIGSVFPDLYCLDSQRTLSLIDGRRTVSTNSSDFDTNEPGLQFDANATPAILIDRVEILGVGSTPVYGSDAIAGTVNIILKDRFDGFDIDLESNSAHSRPGDQYKLSALFGKSFANDRGSFVAAYEYFDQEGLQGSDRDFSSADSDYVINIDDTGPDDGIPFLLRLENTRVSVLNPAGIPTPFFEILPEIYAGPGDESANIFFSENGNPLTFGDDGRLRELVLGEPTGDPAISIGGDGDRLSTYLTLRTPSERHAFYSKSRFEFAENVSGFLDLQYLQHKSSTRADGAFRTAANNFVLPNNALSFIPITVRLENQYLHPDDRAILEPQLQGAGAILGEFHVHRSWTDAVNFNNTGMLQMKQISTGFEGSFPIGADTGTWTIGITHGKSDSDAIETDISCAEIYGVASLLVCGEDGEDDFIRRPFGRIPPTDEELMRLTFDSKYNNQRKMSVVFANIQGKVFELPAGPVEVSLAAERRREVSSGTSISNPDNRVGFRVNRNNIRGRFDTKELAIESVVPLIGDNLLPTLESLDFESSIRWIENSRSGGDKTYSLGGRARFFPDRLFSNTRITLRGNSTRSIRAPSVSELDSQREFVGFESGIDVCSTLYLQSIDNPVLRENCIAEAERFNLRYDPDNFDGGAAGEFFGVFHSGNAQLRNETAKSYTLGVVVSKAGNSGLAFSADLVDIEVSDIPEIEAVFNVQEDCYLRGERNACDRIFRGSEFEFGNAEAIFRNIGKLSTRLVQYNLSIPFSFSGTLGLPGDFEFTSSGQFVSEYSRTAFGDTVENIAGTLGSPKRKLIANLDYYIGGFQLSWGSEYVSSVKLLTVADPEFLANNTIGSYTLHSLSARYQLFESLNLRLGVSNLFDTDPPSELTTNSAVGLYAPLGRYFLLGARLSF